MKPTVIFPEMIHRGFRYKLAPNGEQEALFRQFAYGCRIVDPASSSQTCSACGAVDRESRESQAFFRCQHCGFRAHADHNAAITILRRNTASMRMEEGHKLSGEVRTGNGLARAENPPLQPREDVNRTVR